MIHKQHTLPTHAKIGDAWVCPHKSFKRVLSRGGAWENVNLGETHRDEVNHEQEQRSERAEPEQREPGSAEVSVGSDQSAQGAGDDGQVSGVSTDGGIGGEENSGVSEPAGHEASDDVSDTGEPLTSTGPIEGGSEGEGVDGNGSPVV